MNSSPELESRLSQWMVKAREGVTGAACALRELLAGVGEPPEELPGGWGRVHLAAAAGLPALLRDALVTGALDAASRPCGGGMPPLGYALLSGSRETVEVLLKFLTKMPEQVPFRGEPVSLLALAVEGECRGVAQRLVWRGVPLAPGLDELCLARGRAELREELRGLVPSLLRSPLPALDVPVEPPGGEGEAPEAYGPGILVVETPDRAVLVFDAEAVAVGRQGDNDLGVSDDKVSRYHARFLRMNGGWYLEDRRSSNGTRVNGEEVQGVAPLKNGDVVQVGPVPLRVFLGREAHARQARGQLRLVRGGADEGTGPEAAPAQETLAFVAPLPERAAAPAGAVDEGLLPTPVACAWRAAREATHARGAHAAVLRALQACLAFSVAELEGEAWVAALWARGFRPGLKEAVEGLQWARHQGQFRSDWVRRSFAAWLDACEGQLAQLLVDRRRVAHGLSDPFPARALLGQVLAAAAWLRELELVYVVTARPHGRGQAGTRVQLRGVDPMGAGDAPVQVAWTAPLQAGTVYLHPPGAQRWTALPLLQVSGAAVAVMDGVDVRGRPLYVDVRTGAPVPTVQEAQGACPPPARPAHPRASGATWQQRDGTPPPRRRVRVSETARPDEDDADTTPVKVERFTCAPGLVRDNRSGLTWQREVTSERMTLAQARDYAEALAFAGGGWRLPTREELLGIVDLARREPAVDGVAFPGTPCTGFWAEDPAGGMPWVVYFATGAANSGVETDGWCVRCVREDGAGR